MVVVMLWWYALDVIIEQIKYAITYQYYIISLHHTKSATLYHSNKITYFIIFKNNNNMNTLNQINTLLTQHLPAYTTASKFAQERYQSSVKELTEIYSSSTKQINRAKKTSNELKARTVLVLSQSAQEIIDYIEDKLAIANDAIQGKDKIYRLKNIVGLLKQEYLIKNLARVKSFRDVMLQNGRNFNSDYLLPAYIKLRATLSVSRQFLMETFAQRFGQLQMTYTVSKDTVTLFFSGQFNQEKVMQKIKSNMNSFKNLTVNFVQKGFEVKMEKKEFFQNFMLIYEKLSIVMKEMSTKSIEQWTETKTKTMNLYNSILKRIKEKEVEIKIAYYRQTRGQNEVSEVVPAAVQEAIKQDIKQEIKQTVVVETVRDLSTMKSQALAESAAVPQVEQIDGQGISESDE